MGEEPQIVVGRISRTHGVNGAVYVSVDSDDPERFEPPARFQTIDRKYPMLVLQAARPGPHGLIVEFAGVTTVERAREICGLDLLIDADQRRRLDDGEFWTDQLIGLQVRHGENVIGTVGDVVLGAQDRLVVVTASGSRAEIPFVEELVPEVNVADGWVRVDPPDGLLTPR